MDGVFVYWFGWIAWAIVTFLLPKTKTRFYLAVFILVLLILVPHYMYIAGHHVNFAFLFAILFCCYHFRNVRWYSLLYAVLISCMVASAFASFQLILLYDPVISLYDERLVTSTMIFAMTYLTFHSWKNRLLVTMTGLLQGEWMYAMIINKLFMTTPVGSMYFFDIFALSIAVNGIVWFIHTLLLKVSILVQKRNPVMEAEA